MVPVVIDPGSDPIMRRWDDKCSVTIWLKGYRKASVTLHDGAVIVLKQIGDPEGSTVSVTALHVPKEAAKAYDKGLGAMSDGKLSGAQKQFEHAVALYPDYAQAWSQLGEVLEQQSEPKEAADACEHALKADPKYIRPYLQLIRLAVGGKRMEDAVALGERAMQLDPVEFPGIYYYYDAMGQLRVEARGRGREGRPQGHRDRQGPRVSGRLPPATLRRAEKPHGAQRSTVGDRRHYASRHYTDSSGAFACRAAIVASGRSAPIGEHRHLAPRSAQPSSTAR